jgi:hypothetical protein
MMVSRMLALGAMVAFAVAVGTASFDPAYAGDRSYVSGNFKSATAAKQPGTRSNTGSSNRSYSTIGNIMKTKHDTVKNSISNVR